MNRRNLLVGLSALGVALVLALIVGWQWVRSGAPAPADFADAAAARAGDTRVSAFFSPDPPRQVGNTVWLQLTRAGAPLTDAELGVEAMMPEMGAMPEMRSRADVEAVSPGIYRARFDLEMGGGWTLEVTVDGRQADFGFTVGSRGLIGEEESTAAPLPDTVVLAPISLTDELGGALRAEMDALEPIRAQIAADTLEGVQPAADELASRLTELRPLAEAERADLGVWVGRGAQAAAALGRARDLEQARDHFGEVNRAFVALASADPRLTDGLHIFRCPMTPPGTFAKWIQADASMSNPYMGQEMPGCGVSTDWSSESIPGVPAHSDDSVRIESSRQQRFGIRVAPVHPRPIVHEIRAPGQVQLDERRVQDIALTVGGWVRQLQVDTTGARVRRGQALFELYSPELLLAQQELLLAHARPDGDPLRASSRRKLALFGLTEGQIDGIVAHGEPRSTLPILSPAEGYVVDKRVVEGSAFQPGDLLFRVAPLGSVWIEAEVYSDDLPWVQEGSPAQIHLPHLGNTTFEGEIEQLVPTLRPVQHTRTARIRLDNPEELLLPGMYADVRVQVPLGERLVVPHTAILYTGPRRLVFIDGGEGHLIPREITVGARLPEGYEVRSGLQGGERVVISGAFLVAAESRKRAASALWDAPRAP